MRRLYMISTYLGGTIDINWFSSQIYVNACYVKRLAEIALYIGI